MDPRHPLAFLLAGALAAKASADVSLFIGPPGGPGDVRVYPEATVGAPSLPALLQQIVLLPIDFAGRTELERFHPQKPRLVLDIPNAGRLILPAGQGSLYRYRRDESGGASAAFGYFLVDSSGVARSVFESAGTGPTGTADPLAEPIAIDAAGTTLLVATSLDAGGDLWEVDLVGGAPRNRSSAVGPIDVASGGLILLPGFGAAITTVSALRFSRVDGLDAQPLAFPGMAPAWFEGGIVASADGAVAALIAGAAATSAHVWAFDATSAPLQVTTAPAHLSGVGSMPSAVAGPFLALSPDGSACAWRTEGSAREAWMRGVPIAPAAAEQQLTGDADFIDTLDTIGEFGFLGPASLVILVGESAGPEGGVASADFFRVDLDPVTGATTHTNLSRTSGDLSAPFESKGNLKSEDGIWALPGTTKVIVNNSLSGGVSDLLIADLAAESLTTLASDVKSLDLIEIAGVDLVLGYQLDQAQLCELLRVPIGSGVATTLVSLPDAFRFGTAASRSDGWLACLVTDEFGGAYLARVFVPDDTEQLLAGLPLPLGPTLTFTPSGALATTVDLPAGFSFFGLWTAAGPLLLLPPRFLPGSVLPGA
jgi:hypothetical protein